MTYRTGNHWGVTIVREGEDVVHLIADDNANTTCCGKPPFELARWTGHRLTVEQAAATCPRRLGDRLVAVVVDGDQALAEQICTLLNDAHTPDVDYLHGVNDALTEVRRQLTTWSELADTGEQLTNATVRGMLRDTAAGLGLGEDAPSGPPSAPVAAEPDHVEGMGYPEPPPPLRYRVLDVVRGVNGPARVGEPERKADR